jgi:hypothetical protein
MVCYDHDRAGQAGAIKVFNKLTGVASGLSFVHWPSERPEGYDVRDWHKGVGNPKLMVDGLLGLMQPKPPAMPGAEGEPAPAAPVPLARLTGSGLPRASIEAAYKKWLYLTSTECLDVVFGAVLANRLEGEPLWLFVVAPPGGMKSELLMSISQAPRIVATTSITPHALISGANFGPGSDPSLIPKLNNQVLVIKDFTTIMSMNSLAKEEIFGVLRDAYDGKTEKRFGNGVVRTYESKFGIIAGVTHVVETLSGNNPLGERFLKYQLRAPAGASSKVIRQAVSNLKNNDKMRAELSDIGRQALDCEVKGVPDISDAIIDRIVGLAQWVAYLRNIVSRDKYSGIIHFKPEHEVGTRIAKQLTKLAYGIAIFRGQPVVGPEVYDIIARVALDTAPSKVEAVVRVLAERQGSGWLSTQDLADWSNFPLETLRYILQDLALTGVVDKEPGRGRGWQLSKKIKGLISELGLYGQGRSGIKKVRG